MPTNPDELGALWTKEANGNVFLSGKINGESVVCFQNAQRKEGSNQPQWRVFRARAKGEQPKPAATGEDRGSRIGGRDDSDEIPF